MANERKAARLRAALDTLARGASIDLSVRQVLILLRIAQAGDLGVDQGRLTEDTGVSPAAVSRTIRTLGDTHYSKRHEGFGLVHFEFDPTDNRRRIVRLSDAGRDLIADVLAHV